jgi:ribosomal protein S18 acetylase RimI-like enzyme
MIDLTNRIEAINEAIRAEFARLNSVINSKCGVVVMARRNGTWHLCAEDGSPVARFNVATFPNCGAVAVLCDLHIEPPYRGVGLGRLLHELRMRAAQQAGVRVLLATVQEDNEDAQRLFGKWRKVSAFVNPETGNHIGLWLVQV